MRLTVVGCSGSFAGPESAASCYLLEAEGEDRTWRVLLDLGSGAVGPLQKYVDPLTLDAVLISHLHPDHYFDISGLYVMWKYHPDGARAPIPVWGPRGVGKQVTRAYGLSKDPGMKTEFAFHEYTSEPVRLGPMSVEVTRVQHPVPAYGMRVTVGDTVLAYSGDTGPCRQLVQLASGADLLLCEAAFVEGGDNPTDLHLTGKQAGAAAAEAGVTRLVLTHVPPWHDPEVSLREAREAYDGPLDMAAPGATYEL
jgi:ribonuclease BN (tRNA processing enzyme)